MPRLIPNDFRRALPGTRETARTTHASGRWLSCGSVGSCWGSELPDSLVDDFFGARWTGSDTRIPPVGWRYHRDMRRCTRMLLSRKTGNGSNNTRLRFAGADGWASGADDSAAATGAES